MSKFQNKHVNEIEQEKKPTEKIKKNKIEQRKQAKADAKRKAEEAKKII